MPIVEILRSAFGQALRWGSSSEALLWFSFAVLVRIAWYALLPFSGLVRNATPSKSFPVDPLTAAAASASEVSVPFGAIS